MRAEVGMVSEGKAARKRLAEGKTKVVYAEPKDPALAVIVHKDDITAGDGARRNQLPGKGALSGRTTSNVFRLLSASGIPTHFVDAPAADEIELLTQVGRRVFETLEAAWARQKVQLVDLKIEFGRDAEGNLLVADVIDNDSWRIWPGGRKEAMLDKQVYRDTTDVTDEALRGVLTKYQQVAALTDDFANTLAPATSPGHDRPREACGVFGIWAEGTDVARTTLLGLMALQHRGQESAGVAVLQDRRIAVSLGMGRVDQIFRSDEVDALIGIAAIGHTRYSTTGSSRIENAQPILVESDGQALALGHNGNVVNALELRRLVRERSV